MSIDWDRSAAIFCECEAWNARPENVAARAALAAVRAAADAANAAADAASEDERAAYDAWQLASVSTYGFGRPRTAVDEAVVARAYAAWHAAREAWITAASTADEAARAATAALVASRQRDDAAAGARALSEVIRAGDRVGAEQ